MSIKKSLILIADDEPIVTYTLMRIFDQEGFDVITASDGAAALESALQSHPSAVIMDVLMPKLNGVEAAKRITKMLPDTRIILFSGNAAAGRFIEQALADGFEFEVLSKPVQPQILIDKVRESIPR